MHRSGDMAKAMITLSITNLSFYAYPFSQSQIEEKVKVRETCLGKCHS